MTDQEYQNMRDREDKIRKDMHKHYQEKYLRVATERDKWRGKFDAVRHENNKLRKKL